MPDFLYLYRRRLRPVRAFEHDFSCVRTSSCPIICPICILRVVQGVNVEEQPAAEDVLNGAVCPVVVRGARTKR